MYCGVSFQKIEKANDSESLHDHILLEDSVQATNSAMWLNHLCDSNLISDDVSTSPSNIQSHNKIINLDMITESVFKNQLLATKHKLKDEANLTFYVYSSKDKLHTSLSQIG